MNNKRFKVKVQEQGLDHWERTNRMLNARLVNEGWGTVSVRHKIKAYLQNRELAVFYVSFIIYSIFWVWLVSAVGTLCLVEIKYTWII